MKTNKFTSIITLLFMVTSCKGNISSSSSSLIESSSSKISSSSSITEESSSLIEKRPPSPSPSLAVSSLYPLLGR